MKSGIRHLVALAATILLCTPALQAQDCNSCGGGYAATGGFNNVGNGYGGDIYSTDQVYGSLHTANCGRAMTNTQATALWADYCTDNCYNPNAYPIANHFLHRNRGGGGGCGLKGGGGGCGLKGGGGCGHNRGGDCGNSGFAGGGFSGGGFSGGGFAGGGLAGGGGGCGCNGGPFGWPSHAGFGGGGFAGGGIAGGGCGDAGCGCGQNFFEAAPVSSGYVSYGGSSCGGGGGGGGGCGGGHGKLFGGGFLARLKAKIHGGPGISMFGNGGAHGCGGGGGCKLFGKLHGGGGGGLFARHRGCGGGGGLFSGCKLFGKLHGGGGASQVFSVPEYAQFSSATVLQPNAFFQQYTGAEFGHMDIQSNVQGTITGACGCGGAVDGFPMNVDSANTYQQDMYGGQMYGQPYNSVPMEVNGSQGGTVIDQGTVSGDNTVSGEMIKDAVDPTPAGSGSSSR